MKELVLKRKLKFGVELEVITSMRQDRLVEIIEEAGVKCQAIRGNVHRVLKGAWKVVYDGSVSSGWEVVSPPLKSLDEVEKVCKALNENGVVVNKQCGFHVHHEIKDLDIKSIKNIYEIYNKYEKHIFDNYVPQSRRGDSVRWCKGLDSIIEYVRSCDTIENMVDHRRVGGGQGGSHYENCRYRKVNFRAYVTYGTIEFRQHSGTIDFEKIKHWVLVTHKLIEASIKKDKIKAVSEKRLVKWDDAPCHSSYDFYKELEISDTELSKFWGKRKKALKA